MLSQPKNRKIAAALAFVGVLSPVPLSGLHKFYLGQARWGILYLLLSVTPIPRVASAIEGVWYLSQGDEGFARQFNGMSDSVSRHSSSAKPVNSADLPQVGEIANTLRQLDQLRQDGLISEYEFEQKRRNLLDRIA